MSRRLVLGATVSTVLFASLVATGAGAAGASEVATPVTDLYSTDYQTSLSVPFQQGLLANDDPGLYRPPFVTDVDVSGLAGGTVAVDRSGSMRFTPNAGFHGGTSFTYRITDGNGSVSPNSATVVILVGDVAAHPDSYRLPDRVPSLVVDDPAQGVLADDASAGLGGPGATVATAPGHGTVDLAADGTFTYTPTAGFVGVDSFTYTDTGTVNASTSTVTVTVDPPNADLSITVKSSVAKPIAGSTLSVRVVVRNAGPRAATSVAVGLDVGAGLKITAAPDGLITNKGRAAVWSLSKVSSGRSVSWNVTVRVAATATGTQSVAGAVHSLDLADLAPADDRRTVTVVVKPAAP